MKNIVLASNNRGKIAEFGTILASLSSEYTVRSLADIGFTDDIAEDGTTFAENSLIKALAAVRLGYIGMADDSGLTVDALRGEPGIYSARYAGEHGDDAANRALLLRNLADVPDENRGGAFVCVITMVFPETEAVTVPEKYRAQAELCAKYDVRPEHTISVRGECRGKIGHSERGGGGFGYDSLFLYDTRTFAEMTQAEKNAVSHRGNALRLLAEALRETYTK